MGQNLTGITGLGRDPKEPIAGVGEKKARLGGKKNAIDRRNAGKLKLERAEKVNQEKKNNACNGTREGETDLTLWGKCPMRWGKERVCRITEERILERVSGKRGGGSNSRRNLDLA